MGKLVLIIDQDRDFSNAFLDELKKNDESAMLHSAINGYRALKLLKILSPKIPDLIFVNVKMPVLDGYEIVREIRMMDGFSTPTIIMYGELMSREIGREAIKAGANYYYQKPESQKKIYYMIKRVFKKQNVTA